MDWITPSPIPGGSEKFSDQTSKGHRMTSLFRRLLCNHGFHDLKTAELIGTGDIEIMGKKNHPALRLVGDYEVLQCGCGELFTTGIQTHKQAPA